MIPYGRQNIEQADIDAVLEVLHSDFLTQGPKVPIFEKKIAAKVGVRHAKAVNSATSALHVACMALDLAPGDVLWTSPITFVASANCALYCGADVDFVDIDPATYNMCHNALEEKLIEARRKGRLPRIVVAVHLCGEPCNMHEIHKLSLQFGFKIIEDASHAVGGKYKEDYIGSCKYSDITIFSFHPVKIITTAEGGMALTNDKKLAQKIDLLRSHGITRDQKLMTKPSDGPWYYQQVALGYNYRMNELQAALGISQMARLDDFVAQRHAIAKTYDESFKNLPILLPWQRPGSYSTFHLYVIRLKLEKIKCSHRQVFDELRLQGIGVNLHYIPVHMQPYFQNIGFKVGDFPNSEKYYSEALSIPIYHGLTKQDQDQVIRKLKNIICKNDEQP